jgi:predicted ATPase
MYRREARLVQKAAERVIAFSAEHGFGAWLLFSTTHRGWAIAAQGRFDEGIALMREGLAVAHAAGADIGRADLLCKLAEACMANNRADDVLGVLKEALTAADQQEERYFEPEIHRLKGELLLRQYASNDAEAQCCFERAIEIARKQSGKSLELRATMSLAQLLAKQGHREEARAMLADIYNWFTEGFDTADLQDAKVLLDQLSA